MTPALRAHLKPSRRRSSKRLLRDSRKALAAAEPHRSGDLRARLVAEANETMVENLSALLAERG